MLHLPGDDCIETRTEKLTRQYIIALFEFTSRGLKENHLLFITPTVTISLPLSLMPHMFFLWYLYFVAFNSTFAAAGLLRAGGRGESGGLPELPAGFLAAAGRFIVAVAFGAGSSVCSSGVSSVGCFFMGNDFDFAFAFTATGFGVGGGFRVGVGFAVSTLGFSMCSSSDNFSTLANGMTQQQQSD